MIIIAMQRAFIQRKLLQKTEQEIRDILNTIITLLTAEMLSTWIPQNKAKALDFEESLVKLLSPSIQPKVKSLKAQREKMWTGYHALRTCVVGIFVQAAWCDIFSYLLSVCRSPHL